MGNFIGNIINNISKSLIVNIFSSASKEDKYLDDFIVPIVNDSIVLAGSIQLDSNLGNDLSKTSMINFFKKSYFNTLLKNGFDSESIENMFANYPSNASDNVDLISEYMSHMPFCKFLETTDSEDYLCLRLDGNSKYDDLNTISSILREHLTFSESILLFSFNKDQEINFLHLESFYYQNQSININHPLWKSLLIDAFTQLFLVIEVIHGLWHLITAHIVYIAQESLKGTQILDLFNMSEKNIYLKALEVKSLLFGTKHIFGQVLNDNPRFMKFIKKYLSDFFNNFNIETIYKDYMVHNLPKSNWLIGMDGNINTINKFVSSIFDNTNYNVENVKFGKYLESKYIINIDLAKSDNLLRRYLEILLVVGGSFHSTTLEFGKLIFTDLLKTSIFDTQFYQIATGVITIAKSDEFLGDIRLYTGQYYNNEMLQFTKDLHESRLINNELVIQNTVFHSATFTSIDAANNYIEMNTPSPFV